MRAQLSVAGDSGFGMGDTQQQQQQNGVCGCGGDMLVVTTKFMECVAWVMDWAGVRLAAVQAAWHRF